MYLIPNSDITIGDKRFKGVNDLFIRESIHEIATSCILKLPASSVLKIGGQRQTASLQTAHQFSVGNKVDVNLGNNGKFKNEFKGFVKRINLTTPVEIECEGYSWQLRNKKNIKKSWPSTNLVEVLKEVVKGTDIKLHPMIPAMPLKNLVVNNANGLQVVEYLQELTKKALVAFFMDDVLYVGLSYMDLAQTTVKYRLGWNTISNENLKYHKAEDLDVKIEVKVKDPDGTERTTTEGKAGGVVKKENISAVTESKWLTEIAKAMVLQETFDGYEGDILTFLTPYCRVGYRAEVESPQYPEQGGNYFVEAQETTLTLSGARRKPELGLKLS